MNELIVIGEGKTGVEHTLICVPAQSNYMDTTIGIFDNICDILDGFL